MITATAIDGRGDFDDSDDNAYRLPEAVDFNADAMPAVEVRLRAGEDRETTVTIIAMIDQVVFITQPEFPLLPTLIVSDTIYTGLYTSADFAHFLVRTTHGANPLDVARAIEACLRVEGISISDELEEQQETFTAILTLFEGFTGMGLAPV